MALDTSSATSSPAWPTTESPAQPLAWASSILWPDGRTHLTSLAGSQSEPSTRSWWAWPSVERANILIPADAPAAARQAVRRWHDGSGLPERARASAAQLLMTAQPLAGLLLDRSKVAAIPETGAVPGIVDQLSELLGLTELVVAMSLSAPKANRKPVLQLLDPSGRCLGWAKVGANPLTDAMVANEAHWARRPYTAPLVAPRLWHELDLAGRPVVVTNGLVPGRRIRGRALDPPPPSLFRAVAERGTVERQSVGQTLWWLSVEEILADAREEERAAIEVARRRFGHQAVEVGAWHGDLTPWNMMTGRGRHQLIDWELAADGVPYGFDLCHFHTQVSAELLGLAADEAMVRSARLSSGGLRRLGVAAPARLMVWQLYLIELIRRTVAWRSAGYSADRLEFGPAALRCLNRLISNREISNREILNRQTRE